MFNCFLLLDIFEQPAPLLVQISLFQLQFAGQLLKFGLLSFQLIVFCVVLSDGLVELEDLFVDGGLHMLREVGLRLERVGFELLLGGGLLLLFVEHLLYEV